MLTIRTTLTLKTVDTGSSKNKEDEGETEAEAESSDPGATSGEDTPIPEFPLGARTADDEEIIAEAQRLIENGDNHIDDDEQYRNVILLVGNSGAGKSTLGKILTVTDDDELSSIPAGDRFIIKDREGRISGRSSTVISKSIFPKLLVNPATGDAYYDLPGFGDTRGPAVEIGNADFMKRVGDRASRFKVLIVVNYSSLKSGEIRTDFRNLLDSLHEYLPNLGEGKFKPGIALVANKVDPEVKTESVIPAIAQFLKNAKESLTVLYANDPGRRESSKALIDLLLTKDKKGNGYARLGFFKTPDREGPLSSVPSVQAARTVLNRIISSNTLFVTKAPSDFGLSMSPNTRLFLAQASTNIHRAVAQISEEIAGVIRKYFEEKAAGDATPENLLNFKVDLTALQQRTNALADIGNVSTSTKNPDWVDSIPALLMKLSQELSLSAESEGEIAEGIEGVKKHLKNLAFLDPFLWGAKQQRGVQKQKTEVGARDFEAAVKLWTAPFANLLRDIELSHYNLHEEMNGGLNTAYEELSRDVRELYREKLAELEEILSDPEGFSTDEVDSWKEMLEADKDDVKGLVENLEKTIGSSTVSKFANETVQALSNLRLEISAETLEMLEQFISENENGEGLNLSDWGDKPTPFVPSNWLNSLDKIPSFLDNEVHKLEEFVRDAEYESAKSEVEGNEEGDAEGVAAFETLQATAQGRVDEAERALLQVPSEMETLAAREREILEQTQSEAEFDEI